MTDQMDVTRCDPKGLIRESYRIDGITIEECRSIFLDWAIQVPVGEAAEDHIRACLSHYADGQEDHPMTITLKSGLDKPARKGRRGGRAARMAQ